jgi:hypothetical protein
MQSNICKIEKGSQRTDEIFRESEKVARYNELNHKQALQLRLLCEELVNMLPSIISRFSGEFCIETQGNDYTLCVNVLVDNMDIETRDRLIKVSKNNRNASAVGITGKIRAVFDYMALGGEDPMMPSASRYGFSSDVDFSSVWSLRQYQDGVRADNEQASAEWDELERSIIVHVADDVLVGVKGNNVKMIIKKKFI